MLDNWNDNALIYHIYPIGALGAPRTNDGKEESHRILKIIDMIPHIKSLGFNAVLIGPVFESESHGYDTVDYLKIDSRLGTNMDFREVCMKLHEAGIKVILDAVFNHAGRNIPPFVDVRRNLHNSPYCDWFENLNFDGRSPMGDPFSYEGWNGCYNLVKFNLKNWHICDRLIEAVRLWLDMFDIDGLRLDAADCLNMNFIERLKRETSGIKHDFWLMAEIIHGDYNRWAHEGAADSVTNYECFKGIWSSHNDKNYFEIAHSINRQSGAGGIYSAINLYTFVDNHDVSRIASVLKDKKDLKNCYTLLYGMPGIPSVYYGSEYGIEAVKTEGCDDNLRPEFTPDRWEEEYGTELLFHLRDLGRVYSQLPALRRGSYCPMVISNRQFVFARDLDGKRAFVLLNCDDNEADVTFHAEGSVKYDLYLGNCNIRRDGNNMTVTIPAHEGAIIA